MYHFSSRGIRNIRQTNSKRLFTRKWRHGPNSRARSWLAVQYCWHISCHGYKLMEIELFSMFTEKHVLVLSEKCSMFKNFDHKNNDNKRYSILYNCDSILKWIQQKCKTDVTCVYVKWRPYDVYCMWSYNEKCSSTVAIRFFLIP